LSFRQKPVVRQKPRHIVTEKVGISRMNQLLGLSIGQPLGGARQICGGELGGERVKAEFLGVIFGNMNILSGQVIVEGINCKREYKGATRGNSGSTRWPWILPEREVVAARVFWRGSCFRSRRKHAYPGGGTSIITEKGGYKG